MTKYLPRFSRITVFLAAFAAGAGALAQGAAWPTMPVKIVVGYPPGGPADRMARVLAVPLSKELGQQVLVENKAGASGIVASELVLASTDLHTIFLHTTGGTSVRPHTSKLRYDPAKDFIPVTTITVVPTIFVGNTKVPGRTLRSVIEYAKANPGKLNFALPGSGTTNHLFGAMLKKQAGIEATDIPYSGAVPALNALMAGDADVVNIDIPNAVPLIQANKLTAYAIASEKRSPFLPDVPTTAEVGLPGVIGSNTWGIYVPKAMPNRAIERLRAATVAALHDSKLRETFVAGSMRPQGSSTDELRQMAKDEEARLLPLIRQLNIRLE